MKTKQLLLGAIFAVATTFSIAQPSEVTDAAMAYQSAQSAMMQQKMDRYIEKVVEGKKAVDAGAAQPEGLTHPKTHQYITIMNFEVVMATQIAKQMNIENADLKAYEGKEEELMKQAKESYKKCKELDTKKKRHIKELDEYMNGKLSMLENSARMAFNMKMFDGAFGGFVSCAEIARMIDAKEETITSLDKNAKVSYNQFADSLSKTKKYKEALPILETANATYPDNEYMFETYVTALLETGDNAKAKEVMAESAKKNPNNIHILYNIGITYDAKFPDEAEGVEMLKEGVKNNPENEHLNYITGMMLYNKGTKVYKDFKGAEDTDPKKGDYKKEAESIMNEAIPYLEKAREKHQSKKKIAGLLYKAYSVVGQDDKAAEMRALFTGN